MTSDEPSPGNNMTIEDLRTAWKREPFCPFRINLSDGRSLTVPHPDFLAIPPARRCFVLFSQDRATEYDVIDVRHVTSITLDDPPANGHATQDN